MARPKSKDELLKLSESNFNDLFLFINQLSEEDQSKEFPEGTLNRRISDVLMHLHHWHLMMVNWHEIGMKGGKPDMPAKGYTWKTVPELNKVIREQYNNVSFSDAKKYVKESFHRVRKIIETHSDAELFEKKKYKWTGSTSLGAYLISATSSHYDWARKLIKKSSA